MQYTLLFFLIHLYGVIAKKMNKNASKLISYRLLLLFSLPVQDGSIEKRTKEWADKNTRVLDC